VPPALSVSLWRGRGAEGLADVAARDRQPAAAGVLDAQRSRLAQGVRYAVPSQGNRSSHAIKAKHCLRSCYLSFYFGIIDVGRKMK
jgi:hypothetical protein